jgi:CRP-like cAMP-binding protein
MGQAFSHGILESSLAEGQTFGFELAGGESYGQGSGCFPALQLFNQAMIFKSAADAHWRLALAAVGFQLANRSNRAASIMDGSIGERASLLASTSLFSGLKEAECVLIAEASRPRVFGRDDLLFMQGQPIRNVTLIESGCVKLTQVSQQGSEVILWMRGSRDAVGLSGIPAGSHHTCTARAVMQCSTLVWEWAALDGISAASAQVRRNINGILTGQLNELEERFREIATEKVSKRVALALLRLLKQVGKASAAGIEIPLSREELAQLTGTTLFTVSRLISKWGEQGIVQPRREAVLVCDPQRLAQVVDDDEDAGRFLRRISMGG